MTGTWPRPWVHRLTANGRNRCIAAARNAELNNSNGVGSGSFTDEVKRRRSIGLPKLIQRFGCSQRNALRVLKMSVSDFVADALLDGRKLHILTDVLAALRRAIGCRRNSFPSQSRPMTIVKFRALAFDAYRQS